MPTNKDAAPVAGGPSPGVQAAIPTQPATTAAPDPSIAQLRSRFGGLEAIPPSRNKPLKALFYGATGVGKTTLVGTAQDVPTMRDLLVLDIEDGSMSLASRQDVDVIKIRSYDQLARIGDWLGLYCRARDAKDKKRMIMLEQAIKPESEHEMVAKNPRMYRTISIDSISEVHRLCMYKILNIDVNKRSLDDVPNTPQIQNWGTVGSMLLLLIKRFTGFPMNVFFVAGLLTGRDETKKTRYCPELPGKLPDQVPGFVDVVAYMVSRDAGLGEMERWALFAPGENHDAKDRYHEGNTVRALKNPTLSAFINAK